MRLLFLTTIAVFTVSFAVFGQNGAAVEATHDCDAVKLKSVIDQGANVHMNLGKGERLLHIAVQKNCTEVTKLLISHGADVNAVSLDYDSYGNTPLANMRINYNQRFNYQILDALINAGARINFSELSGRSLVLMVAANSKLSVDEKIDAIDYLLERGADININAKNYIWDLAEIVKSYRSADNNLDFFKFLLQSGFNFNIQDRSGRTFLGIIFDSESFNDLVYMSKSTIYFLVNSGHFDFNIRDSYGVTPLMYLINVPSLPQRYYPNQFFEKFIKLSKVIISKMSPEALNTPTKTVNGRAYPVGENVLARLVWGWSPNLFKLIPLLLDKGANPNIRDVRKKQPALNKVIERLDRSGGYNPPYPKSLVINVIKSMAKAGVNPKLVDKENGLNGFQLLKKYFETGYLKRAEYKELKRNLRN